MRKNLLAHERGSRIDEALSAAIDAVRGLEIPHLDHQDDEPEGQTVH
jgi:hypothetical protein